MAVAASAVLPSSAPRLPTVTSIVRVPVMPSSAIEEAPAPSAVSWAWIMLVASADAPVALPSRLPIAVLSSLEARASEVMVSTLAILATRMALKAS